MDVSGRHSAADASDHIHVERAPLWPRDCGWRTDWRTTTAVSLETAPAERLTIRCGNHVVCEAVLQQLPDDTFSIDLSHGFIDHVRGKGDLASQGIDLLLAEAIAAASSSQSRYLWMLCSEDVSHVLNERLQLAGFHHPDDIVELTMPMTSFAKPPSKADALSFWTMSAASMPRSSAEHVLLIATEDVRSTRRVPWIDVVELLRHVLGQSQDLPGVPRPTPQQLIRLWRLIQADVQLTVALLDHDPVGIAVLSCSEEAEGSPIVVEYFGIHGHVRRQRIGTRLLHDAVAGFSSTPPSDVRTFVGGKNRAADGFFRRCGFRQTGIGQLWIRN